MKEVTIENTKTVVCTAGSSFICIGDPLDIHLSICDHEEADTRIFVHVVNVIKNGHKKVAVRTVDSDIVVLAVAVAAKLNAEIFIEFGTGKNIR